MDSKCFLVAVGSSVELIRASPISPAAAGPSTAVGPSSSPGPQPAHWSSAGGTVFAHGWETASEARSLLANFESLTPSKMAKRLPLSLSPATSLFHDYRFEWVPHKPELQADIKKLDTPPEGVIYFVEWDEVYAVPGDETSPVMTDGCGRISMDLALGIPKIESGRLRPQDEQPRFPQSSAPFAMQARAWVHGNVAKGIWQVDPRLPPRTILVGKDKQLKVKGTPDCNAAKHGIPTFEVLRTYEHPRKARTGNYNLTLLDQLVGDANRAQFRKLILDLQGKCKAELSNLTSGPPSDRQIAKVEERLRQLSHGAGGIDDSPSQMIAAGHSVLDEPYLRLTLGKLQADQYKRLKSAKLDLPGAAGYTSGPCADYSPLLVVVPDPTNSLLYNEIFPIVSGAQIPRPAGHGAADPFEAIAYRDPGMSPGESLCRFKLSAALLLPLSSLMPSPSPLFSAAPPLLLNLFSPHLC